MPSQGIGICAGKAGGIIMATVLNVYNLEFPSHIEKIDIFRHVFTRHDNYEERFLSLQHLVSGFSEFHIKKTTGTHQITAQVELPSNIEPPVFEWRDAPFGVLSDILLLLSMFTGREVFIFHPFKEVDEYPITADSRVSPWGGILRVSIPYLEGPRDEWGFAGDIGFENGINKVCQLIRSEDWQHKYRNGYFLLLAKQAFKRQTLESSFLQCWTIWEHLFTIHNDDWLDRKQIEKLPAADKITYILIRYALRNEIDSIARNRINTLSEIRNRLIHFGRFPERDAVHDDAILFIRLTEFIIAKTLGLMPSNLFNTIEKLEEFISSTKRGR